MSLHPGSRERYFPEEAPVAWDPIRRDLEENVDWYRDLVEHSQDLLCVHDLAGRILSVNPVPARLLGYSVEEMLQKHLRDLIDPRFLKEHDAYLREIEHKGESQGLVAVLTRAGEQRIWEYHNTLRTKGVAVPIVRAIAHDVTERVRAEKALRRTNQELVKKANEQDLLLRGLTLFRTLLDQSNDAIEVIDPESMRFLDVNERSCVGLGYSRGQLLSMTVFDVDPNFDDKKKRQVIERLRESGSAVAECVHRRKDGTTFQVEVNMRRVQLDREYVVAVSRDITARNRANERLREFERVVESLAEMIVVVDREYRYVLANRAFLTYRGITNERVIGRAASEMLKPGVFETVVKRKLDECFSGNVVSYELKYEYPTIGERDLAVTYLPVEGPSGIDHAACVLKDVTEEKRAEKALSERELLFRAVYERSPVGISLVDSLTGRFLKANSKFCEIVGRKETELLQMEVASVTHPDDIEHGSECLRQFAEGKLDSYEIEKRYIRPDGSVRSARVLVVPMWNREDVRRWQMGLVQDTTESRRTEEALRQSEERFRVAIKNSPIAVFNQDRDLRYTWIYNSQLPVPGAEKLGKSMSELFDPKEVERIAEVRRRVIETGVGVRHEAQLTCAGKKRYLDTTIEPVVDASGAVVGITGAAMDVTELRETSEALREAKKKLTEEKLYLEQEIDTELGFGEIIGQSKALQLVMEHVGKVASSDATVLLLGETGTGKELVARAIHRLSQRSQSSFIKMNCAAIPSGLLESELFGNEKGAFTGAISKKIGRLELADRGTLFLDEIGEISLALQPKLLRVLQDQEFERLGGTHTLKVNFRLIAATNRDLADSVRENEFRSDLYYRLNVFPIRVPPLRERREDIRLLVEHFVQKCARRMNKSITSVPKKTMDALMGWDWPGNVRELENFIERSVILTQGSVLVSPLNEMKAPTAGQERVDETLESAEREHILRALRDSHGQIGGPRGAAMRLGLKRTTLQSKLKNLGIDPNSVKH